MSDDDLIRRGDALAAVKAHDFRWEASDAIAALPARGVGVKQLQWNDAAFLEQYAKSVAGTYRVFEKDGLWRATVHTVDDAHFIAETEYLHDAQAAAQADYEARILAALELPTSLQKVQRTLAPTDAAQAREAALDNKEQLDIWAQKPLLDLVGEFVTATWHLLNSSETSGPDDDPTITVWKTDFDRVSDLLDRCEGLPSGSTDHLTAGELLVANILALIGEART